VCKPSIPLPREPDAELMSRLLSRTVTAECAAPGVDGNCWHWIGFRDRDGYGAIKWHGRRWFVHRLSFAFFVGELIGGMQVHHRCFNRACVNPFHLEQITHESNAAQKRRGTNVAAYAAT
jgi:hypothetical protein